VKLLRVLETGTFMRVGTTAPIRPTSASSPPQPQSEGAVADGKLRATSTTGSTCSPCRCRRCATAPATSSCWRKHFLDQHNKQEGTSSRSPPRRSRRSTPTAGRAMCASSRTTLQRAFILADDVIDADLAPTAVAAPETAPILTVRVGTTLDEAAAG